MNENNFQQENNTNIQQSMNMQQETQNSEVDNLSRPNNSNNKLVIIMAIIIVVLLGVVVYLFFIKPGSTNNNDSLNNSVNNNATNNEVTNNDQVNDENNNQQLEEEKEDTDSVTDNALFQAKVNGITVKFPATKESFDGTGWKWSEKYANTDLASGYTTSGGRIGTAPGGVVVTVINNSGETKHISDCIIDDGTFYNPEDGSKDVIFVGGLNFSSTADEVKSVMNNLGYSNLKEKKYDNSVYLDYYLDNDQSNYKDYIEFYYYNNVLKSIGIFTSGK